MAECAVLGFASGATEEERERRAAPESGLSVGQSTMFASPRNALEIGPARDRDFPDLYNLNLEVHILEGDGTIVPYAVTTDGRSGDAQIRFAP